MKSIVIFLLFLIVGLLATAGYKYWSYNQHVSTLSNSELTTKFSLNNAPTNSLKGKIASMSGTVNWLSRVAKKPVQLRFPRSVQQGEELGTAKNGSAAIVIQNAEAILLSPNSHVNFIQLLPINLVIAQDKGMVVYQNTGQSAMSIDTLDLITTVNKGGAKILVDPITNRVTVMVQKGSATVGYEDFQNNSNVITVGVGKEFVFDDSTRTGVIE